MRALSSQITRSPVIGDFGVGLFIGTMISSGSHILPMLALCHPEHDDMGLSSWLQDGCSTLCYTNNIQGQQSIASRDFSISVLKQAFHECFPTDFLSGLIGWDLVACTGSGNRPAMVGLDWSRTGSLPESDDLNSAGGLMQWKIWNMGVR